MKLTDFKIGYRYIIHTNPNLYWTTEGYKDHNYAKYPLKGIVISGKIVQQEEVYEIIFKDYTTQTLYSISNFRHYNYARENHHPLKEGNINATELELNYKLINNF